MIEKPEFSPGFSSFWAVLLRARKQYNLTPSEGRFIIKCCGYMEDVIKLYDYMEANQ
jgi:hypothetical protein